MAEQRRTRPVTWFIKLSLCAGIGAALGGLGGCSSNSNPASTADSAGSDASIGCASDPRAEDFMTNMTHKGPMGLSFVIVASNFDPPAVDNNTWTLKILDTSGQPVKDAVLSFPPPPMRPSDPYMPDHSHGALPAKAVNNNDGTYTVAPLYFFMGGIWSTYIQATVGSITDSTTFTFCVGS
jgi:hypothetical protein